MKKVVSSLFACTLAIMMSFSSVFAYDTNNLDNACNKVVKYYEDSKTLASYDAIIAMESLNLEAENGYNLPENLGEINYNSSFSLIGPITKTLISEILIGNDPKNINGTDFVSMVEDMVVSNEKVQYNGNDIVSAGEVVYIVYALYSIDSEKMYDAADYLKNLQNEDGSFGYGNNTKSLDITGWVIEGLTLVDENKYEDVINKAKTFLTNSLDSEDGAYSDYDEKWGFENGKNSITQAAVLTGIFVNDKAGLLNGNYNDENNKNPIDYLINLQNDNGSFYWKENNMGYGEGATNDCARALGTYKYGSVFKKAQKAYKLLTTKPEENKPVEQPKTEQETTSTNTNTKAQSVQTGDDSQAMIYGSVAIISGGLYLVLRKEYERVH